MTKYLVSAAVAAVIGAAAFTSPAAAQVGVSIGVGSPGYHDGYRGDRRYYRQDPGVTVYSGRSAYRDDCRTRRTTVWENGRKITRTVRRCN